jgi:Outer membrane protein transport protein (OMPP1/FadL/TodX)
MKFPFSTMSVFRFAALSVAVLLSGTMAAQFPNPDAAPLFTRSGMGTARSAGAGGAFSSVGADIGSLELNPAGLGLFRSSDICVTPGLRIATDQALYNGNSLGANHTILQFAQGGAVFTKNYATRTDAMGGSNPFALRSLTFGINYQTEASFDRNQSFNSLNNSRSLIDKYAQISNLYGTDQWSIESYIFSLAGMQAKNALGTYSSNVKAPVQQNGTLSSRGAINKVSLGLGGNIGDKLFFGFSIGIPIMNYAVGTQMSETNAALHDSITHFQNYQLTSNVSESGLGVTGKLGLIYKPVPWARFGVSYSLPTWYFLKENQDADLVYNFDTIPTTEIGPGSTNPLSYQLRTPMKGTVGASFYLKEHGFISVDYEFQNLGSTHYHFSDASYSSLETSINSYMKSMYGFSHTVRVGLEGSIKKLRLRAGYSYTSSPFKNNNNFAAVGYNGSVHTASLGIGGRFKRFYLDLAYVFSYSKDNVSPNFQIPIDQINSRYMSHNVLLTIGFKISRDKSNTSSAPAKSRKRSDELPKDLDPDKRY